MIRFRTFFLGLLALALSCPRLGFPLATGADFLLIEPSARAVGGSGAFTAALGGLDSLSYNPAGLVGLGQALHASFSHIQSFGGWQQDWAAVGFPYKGADLGIEFSSSRLEPFEVYDDLGNQVGTAGAGSMVYGLSCASQTIAKRLWGGLRARGFSSELAGYTNWGFCVDGGLIYQPLDNTPLRLGFSLQNLGAQSAYVEVSDPLPLLYRMGLEWEAYKDKHYSGTAKADLVLNNGANRPSQGRAGIEVGLYHTVLANVGIQVDPVRGLHYMAGAGVTIAGMGISYAYLPHETLGVAHRISLDFQHDLAGGSKNPSKAATVLSPPALNLKAYAYPGQIALFWTPIPGAVAYNVYFNDPAGNWVKWNPGPIESNKVGITSTLLGQTLRAIVRPLGSNGVEGVASNEVSVTTR